MYWRDEWPTNPDGSEYDGKRLLELVRNGDSPFAGVWDVRQLVRLIEKSLNARLVDIPEVTRGSNNYGIHMKLSNGQSIVARLARGDVNMPGFHGFPVASQISELKFEAAVYELLRSQPAVKASRLILALPPFQHEGLRNTVPRDIRGRRFMVFESSERSPGSIGKNWRQMTAEQQLDIVMQAASIRAALFKFDPPPSFINEWLRERLFDQKPKSIGAPVAPTREFCVALFISKIEATIRDIGDMIGWEDDGNVVGPRAAAAKKSLLRFIPHMLPQKDGDDPIIYRLVLEHGDFGIHNMTIADNGDGPQITSVFDWETGCIVPVLLSDTLMSTLVDLGVDDNGQPAVTRADRNEDPEDQQQQQTMTEHYHKVLFENAAEYQKAIQAGKDARHLWFALRDWRGDDPEEYFGKLGSWTERRMKEIEASS